MVTSLHVITTCYNNWFSAEYYRYTIYFSNMNWSRSLVLITDSRSWHFDQSILIISNNYLPDLSDYYFWKIRQNPIIYSHFFLKNLWLPLYGLHLGPISLGFLILWYYIVPWWEYIGQKHFSIIFWSFLFISFIFEVVQLSDTFYQLLTMPNRQ